MITNEMFSVFDQLPGNRQSHYVALNRALGLMTELLLQLRIAVESGHHLDMGFRDREGTLWVPLTRPGMPDPRPGFPRRDLALIEWVSEWAAGVKHHATADIMEMDLRYPELRNLRGTDLIPCSTRDRNLRPGNWLKRGFKAIFGTSPS